MKLLLTSSGISNKTIADSLSGLLGKPFAESKLVFIPTAADISSHDKNWLITDLNNCQKLGFKEIDIVDLAATPEEKIWKSRLESADVFLLGGGNTFYLMHWLRKSRFINALPEFLKTKVCVGISAGSIATGPSLSLHSQNKRELFEIYYEEESRDYNVNEGLGLVNFYTRPHFNSEDFPKARKEYLKQFAEEVNVPVYAIDDQSAIEVIGERVKIVSEGDYLIFN